MAGARSTLPFQADMWTRRCCSNSCSQLYQ